MDCGNAICTSNNCRLSSYSNESNLEDKKEVYTLSDKGINVERYIYRELTDQHIADIKTSNKKDFVLACWAKADSMFVNRRSTDFCGMCDGTEFYHEIDKIYYENEDEYQKRRRFELRAEISYENGKKQSQYCSFDWMNTDWQHCALPISLSENENDVLKSIRVYFDYSFNMGEVTIFDMDMREGAWDYYEYNEDKQKIYYENSISKYITTYEYYKKKLVKESLIDKDNYALKHSNQPYIEYSTIYEYDNDDALVRVIDFNDIVTEYEYNKGIIVKSCVYNRKEPSNKFIKESILDEKGNIVGELDGFGNKQFDYEYIHNTDLISAKKGINDCKVVYGYDFNNDMLLTISSDVNGEVNENVSGYTLGILTSLRHNDTDICYDYDGFGRITNIRIADNNYVQMGYEDVVQQGNIIGEKITKSYSNGTEYESITDDKGNILSVKYNNNNYIQNQYDTFGRLCCVKDYTNSKETKCEITLDNQSNVVEKKYVGFNRSYCIKNTYNENEIKTNTSTFIDGLAARDTSFIYDNTPNNRVIEIDLPNNINQDIKYDKLGRINNLLVRKNVHNIDLALSKGIKYVQKGEYASNLVASECYGKNGVTKEIIKYQYDRNGNIICIIIDDVVTVKYAYDNLNRLIREDNKKLNKTTIFSYDNGGNITSKIEYDYTNSATGLLTDGSVTKFNYASDGWQDMLLGVGGLKCGDYDALGNPRLYRGKKIEWSHGRQLDKIGDIEYKYNAQGIRIEKIVNGLSKKYYVDDSTILAEETNGNTIIYTYGADGILGFNYNTRDYYYKKNVQGDVLAILDENGEEIVQYVYDAWGNHKVLVLDNGTYKNITESTASEYNNIAVINPIRYRGYYYDNETGLYYLNSRYYDPEIGRFINADDISYVAPDTLNGLNLYAYCGNNPVMNVDPNGTFLWSILFGAILAGALVGGISSGVSAAKNGETVWKEALIGTLKGAVTGAAFGLGGAFGAATFAGTVISIGTTLTAFGGTLAVSFGVGIGIYSLETHLYNKEFNWNTALGSGVFLAAENALNFGMGFLLGSSGYWPQNSQNYEGIKDKIIGSSKFMILNRKTIMERMYLKAVLLTPITYILKRIKENLF